MINLAIRTVPRVIGKSGNRKSWRCGLPLEPGKRGKGNFTQGRTNESML
jgi:hypothetical protein